jgi:hypothetical protein
VVRVSVVVPARNEEPRIGECLRALLAQDYPRELYEVIVVDDGSEDCTAEVAAGLGLKVLRQPPLGGAAARNLGVAHARGEVVAFTDADCVADRSWLRHLVAAFQDPRVAVSTGEVVGECRSAVARYVEDAGTFRLAHRWRAHPWPAFVTANVAYRKAVFDSLGGFNPALRGASDLEMGWRVAEDGRFCLASCPGAVVRHAHPTTARGLYEQWRGYGAGRCRLVTQRLGPRAAVAEGGRQSLAALCSVLLALPRSLLRLPWPGRRARAGGPLLDAVRAVAFAAGYWSGYRGRPPDGSWRDRAARSRRPRTPEVGGRTVR